MPTPGTVYVDGMGHPIVDANGKIFWKAAVSPSDSRWCCCPCEYDVPNDPICGQGIRIDPGIINPPCQICPQFGCSLFVGKTNTATACEFSFVGGPSFTLHYDYATKTWSLTNYQGVNGACTVTLDPTTHLIHGTVYWEYSDNGGRLCCTASGTF
jgi:hypothetical protein